ncbi:hypothetical protein ACC771_05225, partial [Rhizobium ruizarguesonis]
LDLGGATLDEPVQVAVQAPAGATAGETVYFFRNAQLPLPDGSTKSLWLLAEFGTVGDDGFIRTNSPPYPGLVLGGTYIVVRGAQNSVVSLTSSSDAASFAIINDGGTSYGMRLLGDVPLAMPIDPGSARPIDIITYNGGAIS